MGQDNKITSDTKTRILDVAERMTQTRGYNGFSYLDIADEIGIKTSSIHYHFKNKDDLAIALVNRTIDDHSQGFDNIEKSINLPQKRLQAVIDYFKGYVKEQRFCLCGMMALELLTVSPKVIELVNIYFKNFENWLAKQYKAMGKTNSKALAISFLSALEGSLLFARLHNEPEVIDRALKVVMKA